MSDTTERVSHRLRADTAAIHARTEADMDLLGRMGSREGYTSTLIRMEAFYRGAEPAIFQACADFVPERFLESRLARLHADLKAIAPSWLASAAVSFPKEIARWPEALGALYVMEGAALGGQIIARHVSAVLGFTPEYGASFFASEGVAVGPRWKAFRDLLDAYPDEYEAILAGAQATFEAFRAAVATV